MTTKSDWQSHRDDDGIHWLVLDKAGTDTNVLSINVLQELDALIEQLEGDLPRAVVFRSGKTKGFIAGADVNEFLEVTSTEEALAMIQRGQQLFNRVAALPCPTIAMIEGFCMGGGTELALACDYRIALDDSACKIGLPEVKLGNPPGLRRPGAVDGNHQPAEITGNDAHRACTLGPRCAFDRAGRQRATGAANRTRG